MVQNVMLGQMGEGEVPLSLCSIFKQFIESIVSFPGHCGVTTRSMSLVHM